jgi:hypothetical protein
MQKRVECGYNCRLIAGIYLIMSLLKMLLRKAYSDNAELTSEAGFFKD